MRQQHSRSLISADRVRPALVASLAGALAAAAAVASPPPGILAHWTFDQVGSATAVDGVGGANGTLVGGAAMVAGGVSGGAAAALEPPPAPWWTWGTSSRCSAPRHAPSRAG